MEVLHDMFPSMKATTLQSVLNECGGDVERAVDSLLSMEVINMETVSRGVGAPVPPPSSCSPSPHLTQLELDELLAKELAADSYSHIHSRSDPDSISYLPSSHGRESYSAVRKAPHARPHESHTVALEQIDAGVMSEMIAGVKGSVIPLLLQQLQALEVPAVEEQIDAGKLGLIKLSLDQIHVANANVPEDSVNISVEGVNIKIAAKEITARLQQFKWAYEKITFPKVKDSGNADASVTEATIQVILQIASDEYGNPSFTVSQCEVNAGKLDIKISGSLASFMYNTLLGLFKKSIKSTLETSLAEMITSSVNRDSSFNLF